MKTHDIGTIGELHFATKAIRNGFQVYFPANGTQPGHDIVLYKDGVFTRVQVRVSKVNINNSSSFIAAGCHGARGKKLPEDSYDTLAIVCFELDKIWLVPKDDIKTGRTFSKSILKISEWDKYVF